MEIIRDKKIKKLGLLDLKFLFSRFILFYLIIVFGVVLRLI